MADTGSCAALAYQMLSGGTMYSQRGLATLASQLVNKQPAVPFRLVGGGERALRAQGDLKKARELRGLKTESAATAWRPG